VAPVHIESNDNSLLEMMTQLDKLEEQSPKQVEEGIRTPIRLGGNSKAESSGML